MRRLFITVAAVLACWAGAMADNYDLTLEENIASPSTKSISKKAAKAICDHIAGIGSALEKRGLKIAYDRHGEVVEAVIPCSELFAPNSVELKANAHRMLDPFTKVLAYPTMYKVIVAVHSDDTGEIDYTDALTAARAEAIEKYLCGAVNIRNANLIPYGMGQDEPVADNNSVAGRAENRRVEIIIVPERQMIEDARAGRLK